MDKEYRYLQMQKQALQNPVDTVAGGLRAIGGALNRGIDKVVEKGKTRLFGELEPRASSDKSVGSWKNTLNPFSGFTGGVDYVPAKWYKLFTDGKRAGTEEYAQALKSAHLSWKSLALGLLTAGVVGGFGALRHAAEHAGISEGDYVGNDLSEQLSTTFTGDLTGVSEKERRKRKRFLDQQKNASLDKVADPVYTTEFPSNISTYGFFQTAVPLGAMLLAGSLAWHGVNEQYNQGHNEDLTKSIEAKRNALKRIVAERARLAKGTQLRDPVRDGLRDLDEDEIYTKDASLNKAASGFIDSLAQTSGLLFSAIVLASAIGSYHFTKASDPNNIAYSAYNRALKEYAKNRASVTPLAIEPDEAQAYFDYINNTKEPEKKKRTAREQPAIDTDALNKPISISI